mmetsp:Transcript_51528/g.112020  ORF Transcript_51528/g.112020 Transcript_51528/m.112020 type:complete len:398 (-) Transcript_51528:449-1642(-)
MLPIECEGWYEDEDSVAMAVWWAPENELIETLKALIEDVQDPLANAYLRGMLLLRVLDPDDVRVPDIEARVSETASRVAVHRLGRVEIFDSTLRGDMCTRLGCAVSHGRLHGEPRRDSIMHWVPQNTECEAWRKLVAYIEQVKTERRTRFTLADALSAEEVLDITTLPPSIGTLTHLQEINLYGTNLSRLPPELGNLTELKTFSAYTSYGLHWFPYELVHCQKLTASKVSTRASYDNPKNQSVFPPLRHERFPLESLDPAIWHDYLPSADPPSRPCSVCRKPFQDFGHHRVWVVRAVATDVLPLLVNACSEACLETVSSDQRAAATAGTARTCHRGGVTGEGQQVDLDMILTKSAASGGISIPTAGEGEGDAQHISGDTHHRPDDAQHRPAEEQVGI